jgi:hypothetical protein
MQDFLQLRLFPSTKNKMLEKCQEELSEFLRIDTIILPSEWLFKLDSNISEGIKPPQIFVQPKLYWPI